MTSIREVRRQCEASSARSLARRDDHALEDESGPIPAWLLVAGLLATLAGTVSAVIA